MPPHTVVPTVDTGLRAVSDPSPWLRPRVGQFLRDGGRFGQPDPFGYVFLESA